MSSLSEKKKKHVPTPDRDIRGVGSSINQKNPYENTFGIVRFLLLHSLCIAAIRTVAVIGGFDALPLDRLVSSLSALTPEISTNPATWNAPGRVFKARGLSTGSYSETNSFQAFDRFSFSFPKSSGMADGVGNSLVRGLCWLYSCATLSVELICSMRSRSPMFIESLPLSSKWCTRTRM